MNFVRPICLLVLVAVFFTPFDPTTKLIVSLIAGTPFIWDFVVSIAKRFSSRDKQ
jgi:hypothetical protein